MLGLLAAYAFGAMTLGLAGAYVSGDPALSQLSLGLLAFGLGMVASANRDGDARTPPARPQPATGRRRGDGFDAVSGSLPQLQKGETGATQQQPGQGSEPDPVIPGSYLAP